MKISNGKIMEISPEEIREIIAKGDSDMMRRLLTSFGFSGVNMSSDSMALTIEPSRRLAEKILSLASAYSGVVYPSQLDHRVGEVLIKHLSPTTDISAFLSQFMLRQGESWFPVDSASDLTPVSKRLLKSIRYNHYSPRLAHKIANLSQPSFLALVKFMMSDEVHRCNFRLSYAFLHYIYEQRMLPDEIFFAYMLTCREKPVPALNLITAFI